MAQCVGTVPTSSPMQFSDSILNFALANLEGQCQYNWQMTAQGRRNTVQFSPFSRTDVDSSGVGTQSLHSQQSLVNFSSPDRHLSIYT